ncbi:MAG: hypothetical protein KGM42_19490 [Hyphomicrobiales bacterium]|nr:hypothetical protein [Hyphomicrobiales bacterium]
MSAPYEREIEEALRAEEREIETEAVRLAARLSAKLGSLIAQNPARGEQVFNDICAGALSAERLGLVEAQAPVRMRGPQVRLVAPEPLYEKIPEVEAQIMDVLEAEPRGMGLPDLHERLLEAGLSLSRGNLSVRLHRMVKAARVESPARGFYVLTPGAREKRERERRAP